eukprot:g1967.t1
MSDETGAPSSSAAPEILSTTTTKLNDGVTALENDQFEEAVEKFEEVLQTRTAHFGELSLETALPHYYYGVALLHYAQSTRDVFAEGTETGDQLEANMEEDEENPSELTLAWEALECARRIYEKQSTPHSSPLASVHVVLGDVALESSNLALALQEFTKAISYLEKTTDDDNEKKDCVKSETRSIERRFSEAYYKAALASEFLDELPQALDYTNKAIGFIQQEINSKEGKEEAAIKELKDIEKDLVEHKEGLEIACKQNEEVKDMLRQMFEKQVVENKEPQQPEQEKEVIDLGIFGRRKHRFAKEDSEKKTEADINMTTASTPAKRAVDSTQDNAESSGSKRKKTEDDNSPGGAPEDN